MPVIRNADEKNLLGLSRARSTIWRRARARRSSSPTRFRAAPSPSQTPASSARVYGLPLINQPQVAILGVGDIEKRAVVIDDAIAIRPMCHLTLGYDHRLIDGADGGRILSYEGASRELR